MRRIRILHVAQAAGGVDRYIRMLLKYLDKDNLKIYLFVRRLFIRKIMKDLFLVLSKLR